MHRVTTNDNEWYKEWQRMTPSDNEWSFKLAFFFTNKRGTYLYRTHPVDNYLILEEDVEEWLLYQEQKKSPQKKYQQQEAGLKAIFFLFIIHATLKIYGDSMTQT